MADFDTWKFDSLVQFARESQERNAFLEGEVTRLRAQVQEMSNTLAECDKDRKDLLVELRRMIVKELGP